MRELFFRGISGLLYAAMILGSVVYDQLLFIIVIVVFSTLAIIEFQRLIRHKSYMPMALVLLLIYNFYQSKIDAVDLIYPLISVFIAHIFLIYWLFTKKTMTLNYLSKTLLSLFYLGMGCFFIISLPGSPENYDFEKVMLFFVLIWTNNTFAYLTGRKLGKTLMFQRISPKKTWEGFFGGLIFSLAVALVFHHFSPESSVVFYLSVASLCSIWATVGDLIQSKFKRLVNVKDSGSLIPGHGGFFDRMDSVIFTAPWIYLLFNFKDYVS